jgi:hypothetical protein
VSCQKTGCGEVATHVPSIEVPYHHVFKTIEPTCLVLGLELCLAHAREVEGEKSELIDRAYLGNINKAFLLSGRPAMDLMRAKVVAIPIADERYQVLKKTREGKCKESGKWRLPPR